MKLLESKIIYHLEFEFIWKELVKGKAVKAYFKTMKDTWITPR